MPSTGHPAGDLLIYLAGILVALGTIWRYVYPAVKGIVLGTWRAGVGIRRLYVGTQQFIHEWHGDDDKPGVPARLAAMEVEIRKTNGGSTLRDLARAGAEGVARVETSLRELTGTTERLEGYASQNREGISKLGDRVTDHRRRNDETISEIRRFLAEEHADALAAAEHLRASVSELLMVEGHEERAPLPADHEPDLS